MNQQSGLPRLLSYEDIISKPVPPIEWDVEGLLAHGDRVVIFGEFGSCKSWLLLHLGLLLASGKPWLDNFPLPRPFRVLYVDCEMREQTLRRRIKRLALGAGLDGEPVPFYALSRPRLVFHDPTDAARLLQGLQNQGCDPDIVIIESLTRVFPGDENAAKDVAAFWRAVEPIPAAGKTLIISHHMRKQGFKASNAAKDRARGSTDILAGSDASFAITREPTRAILVENTKMREADTPDAFLVSFHAKDPDGPVRLVFEGSADESFLGRQERATSLILTYLAKAPAGTAETEDIHAYVTSQGPSKATNERALRALEKQGLIRSPRRGLWQLTGGPPAN